MSGQQSGKRENTHVIEYGRFLLARFRKNVDPSAHMPLARTQSMTTLNSQKPGNGSNSMPRRKRVWGFGERKVRETALKSGKLCTRLCSFKAEGRKEPSCLRNLSFVRMTLDIRSLLPVHLLAPSIRLLPKKCRDRPSSELFSPLQQTSPHTGNWGDHSSSTVLKAHVPPFPS